MRAGLFAAAFVTTMFAGCLYASAYQFSIGIRPTLLSPRTFSLAYAYAIPLLAIVLAHEGGHWLVARWHGIRISGPWFLPLPWPWFGVSAGLLGAFVWNRQPFPDRPAMFDYAIAGPLLGFLVTVPVVLIGVWLSHDVSVTTVSAGAFREPLLLQWISGPKVYHPTLTAGWWGLVLTAVQLLPVPPLDGWKIARVWTQDGIPLGRARLALTGLALCLLLLCWPVGS